MLAVSAAAAVSGCLYVAGPAEAVESHGFSFRFGAGDLSAPAGVAVNASTGNVYVADAGEARVVEFSPAGTLVRAWGWGVVDGASAFEECTLSCKPGVPGAGAGQFETPSFIAVDNSAGPSKGDVYVGDTGDGIVSKFTGEGVLESSWGDGGVSEAANGQLVGSRGTGKGTLTTGSTTIATVTASTGAFSVGQEVTGAGIPAATTINAVGVGTLEISQAAETTGMATLTAHASFATLAGVAVDSGGDLNVLALEEPRLMYQFSQTGSYTDEFEPPDKRENTPAGLTINAAGEFFKVNRDGSVEELTSSADIGQLTASEGLGTPGAARGMTATGSEVYVADAGMVLRYLFKEPGSKPGLVVERGGATCQVASELPCPATSRFGAGSITDAAGVAVNPGNGKIYVVEAGEAGTGEVAVWVPVILPDVVTSPVSEAKPTSATLNGTVNPDGVEIADCHFDYGTTLAYGQTAACEQTAGSGGSPVQVTAHITGLAPGTSYHVRLQAENANDIPEYGGDMTFATQPPPAVTSPGVSGLSAAGATLEAQIDPGTLDTVYHFEYGPSTGYGTSVPVPSKDIGSGDAPVAVSAEVTGLEPDTTYHWRVIATNEAGTTISPDHTFVYPGGTGELPDGRAYEMVTPPHKNAALVNDIISGPPPDISENGERVIIGTVQCFAGAVSCVPVRQSIGTPYLYSRGPSGWSVKPLSPSASEYETNSWWSYSAEAETAVFSAPTAPHGEDDFYARSPAGAFTDIGPLSDPAAGENLEIVQDVDAVAGSADLSRLVFDTLEPAWPFSSQESVGGSLFQYVGTGNAEPELVGVSGGFGSRDQVSACGTKLGGQEPGDAGAESADGRVVYFTTRECGGGTGVKNEGLAVPVAEVFARVGGGEVGARTVAVSEPQAPEVADEPQENCSSVGCVSNTSAENEGAWRPAVFYGTSTDGSKAFLSSAQQLTNGAVQESTNLYLYDADSVGHHWFDVSEGEGGKTVAGGPRVRGVLAYSSDGSHVYFVAQGVLTGANVEGHTPVEGAYNLYAYQRDSTFPDGHLAFIDGMSSEDINKQLGLGRPGVPANVTPDGRFLVFTSTVALTGDVSRTDGAVQVYRYDAGSGLLSRVSIGERGYNDDGNAGTGDAMIAPGYRGYERLGVARPDPTMANDGSRVFFMSPVALTAKALNDVALGTREELGKQVTRYAENVYEWELEGVGSCPAGESAGCVFLISDGRDTAISPSEACIPGISATCLIGSDASGANVFFATADELVGMDTDTQVDVYDARICEPASGNPCLSGAAPVEESCAGEACHGVPPATPGVPAPGSQSFNGAENQVAAPVKPVVLTAAQKLAKALRVCREKRNKHKRRVCEAQARHKYAPAKKTARKPAHKTAHKTAVRVGGVR